MVESILTSMAICSCLSVQKLPMNIFNLRLVLNNKITGGGTYDTFCPCFVIGGIKCKIDHFNFNCFSALFLART